MDEKKEQKAKEELVLEKQTIGQDDSLNQLFKTLGLSVAPQADSTTDVLEAPETFTEGDMLFASLNVLLRNLDKSKDADARLRTSDIDSAIEVIDRFLSKQVSAIIHHPKFQSLESAWRSVEFLVRRTNFRKNIEIKILDVTKDEILDDADNALSLEQSDLFRRVYLDEYGILGGKPYAAIIGDYEILNNDDDIKFLRHMGQISAAAHAPFISSVGPKFFGFRTAEELDRVKNINRILSQKKFAAWREFRKEDFANYIALTLPRFQLRNPFDPMNQKIKTFNFKEAVDGPNEYLWGNTAVALTSKMIESFQKTGWGVYFRGVESGGKVSDLPLHVFEIDGIEEQQIPTEFAIPDFREKEFSDCGFIPLVWSKDSNYAVFFGGQSIQEPQLYDDDQATANARLTAKLPYMLAVSRVAHYLKQYMRDKIGATVTREGIEGEMNRWLKQYVSADPNPDARAKAKYPFRKAEVQVFELADNPGYYDMKIFVVPHIQLEGINAGLSLTTKLPKERS
ncbi:type VI secretion system contractile sheath large subunit [bacterium]|nr:type VI secretion system contractile sheath large subunit [candidate division CSSED10-310 bacterium]